jgi:hypothetical protein
LVRALSPRFANPDDAWAQSILPESEYSVFARMDPRDREHAVRVTRKLLTLHPNSSRVVQRAALLHDCGKLLRPYYLTERVWYGLLYGFQNRWVTSHQRLELPKSAPSAAEVKAFHPQFGAQLILGAGGDPRVAEIVGKHHDPGNDLEARLVHEVDELE